MSYARPHQGQMSGQYELPPSLTGTAVVASADKSSGETHGLVAHDFRRGSGESTREVDVSS